MLQKANQVDPFNPLLQRSLILRFIDLQQHAHTRAATNRYSEIFPQDFIMRQKFEVAMQSAPEQWFGARALLTDSVKRLKRETAVALNDFANTFIKIHWTLRTSPAIAGGV